MSRRTTIRIVLAGVMCVMLVVTFAAIRLVIWAHDDFLSLANWLDSSIPPSPRPMFHQWGLTDRGYEWVSVPLYQDSAGVWLYMDVRLDIVVVFATHDQAGQWRGIQLQQQQAVLMQGTPYQVTVQNAPHALLWVGAPGEARFTTEPGVAARIEEAFRNDPDASADLLKTLVGCYEGPDKSRLEALVEGYDETATSRAGDD